MARSFPEHLGRALVGVAVGLAVALAPPAWARAPAAVAGEGTFEVSLGTEPARIVLGRVRRVTLDIRAPDPEGPLRPLQASVNVGRLGEVERVGPGRYQVIYTPPRARYPQLAVVAVWRETGPKGPVAFFRVPLLGTARVPLETDPGASVTVTVAGERFGPFEADATGSATARLVAPPGVPEATVVATGQDGRQTSATLALQVPPYNRLTLAVVPHAIVADGVDEAGLYLYYDATGRRAPKARRVRVTAPVGEVAPMRRLPGPVYGTTYRARAGLPDQTVAFQAGVAGDAASGAGARVSLGRQQPAQVVVAPRAVTIHGGPGSEMDVEVAVLDALGLGVAGAQPVLEVDPPEAGRLEAPERRRQGVWAWRFRPGVLDPREETVRVRFVARYEGLDGRGEVTVRPRQPARLELTPLGDAGALPADGAARIRLEARAFDGDGVALPGLRPEVDASLGSVRWEEDGALVYQSPRLEVLVDRGEPLVAASRADRVEARLGQARGETQVQLVPLVGVRPERGGFAEASGAWQSGRGGPGLSLAMGVRVFHAAPWAVSLGVVTGVSGLGGAAARGPARLGAAAVPLLAQARLGYRVTEVWDVGLSAEAGALSVVGAWRLPGGGEVPFSEWTVAAGAGAWVAPQVGPGRLVAQAGWRTGQVGAAGNQAWEVGSVGGLRAMIGYRLEL